MLKTPFACMWCSQTSVLMLIANRCNIGVWSRSSLFWSKVWQGGVKFAAGSVCVCKEWIRQSTVWCITDLTSPVLLKSGWGGKDGETWSVTRLILLTSPLCFCLQPLHLFLFFHPKPKIHIPFQSGLFHFTGWESHSLGHLLSVSHFSVEN